jgi:hypothetical protein
MAYEFGSMLYRNSRDMHVAMAEEWLSAGGANHRDDMLESLAAMSDEALADEAIEAWTLDENEDFDRSDFLAAWADVRSQFDAHFPNE